MAVAVKIYRFRGHDVATGVKTEVRHKADEIVETIDVTKRAVMFSYVDGNSTSSWITKITHNSSSTVKWSKTNCCSSTWRYARYVRDYRRHCGDSWANFPVELVIEETDPSIKGASASARTKPARLSTDIHFKFLSTLQLATKLLWTQLNVNTWTAQAKILIMTEANDLMSYDTTQLTLHTTSF